MCEAVLAFKIEPGVRSEGAPRAKRKVAHQILHCTALLFVVLGLSAIFLNHHCKKKHEADACQRNPPLYTLHSLSGIITSSLFAVQAVGGFYSYWMRASSSGQCVSLPPRPRFRAPGRPLTPRRRWKADLLPFHRVIGLATFFMGLATMCMGLAEKEWLLVAFGGISKHGTTMHMANAIGVMVLVLGFLVALYHGAPKRGHVESGYDLMGAA